MSRHRAQRDRSILVAAVVTVLVLGLCVLALLSGKPDTAEGCYDAKARAASHWC